MTDNKHNKKKIEIQNDPLEQPTEQTAQSPQPQDRQTPTEQTLSLEQQLAEMKDRWQRLAADYQNYQKRAQRQIEQASQFAQENIAKALLPVLDNFQHTLEKGPDATDVNSLLQGIQIVYDHLFNVLQSFGMNTIKIESGDPFDPSLHEAIFHEPTDEVPQNNIMRQLATGYTMNERTLRPAKVSIAKTPPTPTQDDTPKEDQPDQANNNPNN